MAVGLFPIFIPGKTEQLKPVYADAENVPQLLQVIHASKYIVLYYELEHARNSPANVMQALSGVQPEKPSGSTASNTFVSIGWMGCPPSSMLPWASRFCRY